jgi:drug/metabolite transporter (DMT)-like permease
VTAFLALAAAALWGTSDFGGGLISRRLDPRVAVLVSQALALAGLIVLLPLVRVPLGSYLLLGAGAGMFATLSLAAFYRAMADAPISLVAPITAAGTGIPVIVGLARGEHLGLVQLAGIAVTLIGVVLASGPEVSSGVPVRRQAIGFAIAAAIGFGVAYTLLALAAGTSVYGTLLSQRIAGLVVLSPIVVRSGRPAGGQHDR